MFDTMDFFGISKSHSSPMAYRMVLPVAQSIRRGVFNEITSVRHVIHGVYHSVCHGYWTSERVYVCLRVVDLVLCHDITRVLLLIVFIIGRFMVMMSSVCHDRSYFLKAPWKVPWSKQWLMACPMGRIE